MADDLVTLREFFEAHRIAHEREHGQHEKEHTRDHQATEQAIRVAVAALDKRLDSMNEFRQQLTDQQRTEAERTATLVRRDMLDSFKVDQEKKFDQLTEQVNELRRGSANMSGRMVGISAAFAVVVVLINIALRFL